jgi:hypothetical protein
VADLIRAKRATNRDQDRIDAARLEQLTEREPRE